MQYNTNITNDLVNENKNKNFFVHEAVFYELINDLPEKEKKHLDKWLYIDHMMNARYLFKEDKEQGIEINKQLLQKTLSCRRENLIMKWYKDKGFIRKVKNYCAGKHSTTYDFTPQIKFQPIIKKQVEDQKLSDKLKKEKMPKTDLEKSAQENLLKFEIDSGGAMSEIKNLIFTEDEKQFYKSFFERAPQNSIYYYKNIKTDNKIHNTNNQYPYYYVNTKIEGKKRSKIQKGDKLFKYSLTSMLISYFHEKDFFCFRDTAGGRLHTNLTILKRELRKYLSVPGLDLVNLDIANSQPLILNTLYSQNKKYLELCETGQLWDYLMNKCDVSDRKQFKGDMFGEVFYCSLWGMLNSEKSKIFKGEFPDVWQFIYDYKKAHGKASLPIAMQRKEANIILDTVCQQLANSSIWFATIHDSIICDRLEADHVKQLIIKAFNQYSINPTITEESL